MAFYTVICIIVLFNTKITTADNIHNKIVEQYKTLVAKKVQPTDLSFHSGSTLTLIPTSHNFSSIKNQANSIAKVSGIVEKIPCSFYGNYENIKNAFRVVFLYGKCSGTCKRAETHFNNILVNCILCTENLKVHEKNGGEWNALGVNSIIYADTISADALSICGLSKFDSVQCCNAYTNSVDGITSNIALISQYITECQASVGSLCVKQCYALIDALSLNNAQLGADKSFQIAYCG